jgi:hypothetical protein
VGIHSESLGKETIENAETNSSFNKGSKPEQEVPKKKKTLVVAKPQLSAEEELELQRWIE